jgi:hypothetical protein
MKEKGFKTREEALHFLIEQYWQINSPAAHI